jgi:alkylation response protein AidB-like acyl-CoA dehydrogenase
MDFELTEEQRMLKDTVARFVEREITPRAAQWDEQEAFPSEVFRAMGDLGLFGISIPEAYGDSGAGVPTAHRPGSWFSRTASSRRRTSWATSTILKNLLNGADPFPL